MEIALVVSDVDGTLVTTDKRLTDRAIEAVRRLGEAGIAFTIASSRPPIGLKRFVEPLDLRLPMGAFNGSTLVSPDLVPISTATIPPEVAHEAVRHLHGAGIDVWVFANDQWILRDPEAPYTDLQRRTIGSEPTVASDLTPYLGAAAKIVGVTRDVDLLAHAEAEIADLLAERAGVHRSQAYYLDITPPGVDKGTFVEEIARRLGLAKERVATIGDARNDVAMFRVSGCPIAMGNAVADVRNAARITSATNDEDGFALAIERLLDMEPAVPASETKD